MRRVIWNLLVGLLVILIGVPVIAGFWAYFSLDHEYAHTEQTMALPECDALTPASAIQLCLLHTSRGLFRTRLSGQKEANGNVVLLHGFPESSAMYEPMMPDLAKAGFQAVAFDQRGYSPTLRPEALSAYDIEELKADVFAVADAAGFDEFHLVGHDWGAAVGWQLVFSGSPRILTWSALSIPHMGAYAQAMTDDADQQERSAYIGFFQLPVIPETIFSFNNFQIMRTGIYAQHDPAILDEYLAIFREPGALTAALNWYRAVSLTSSTGNQLVRIPTAFIWGNQDPVVGARALEAQSQYFDKNLFLTELDTGHWLMETAPQAVSQAVLENLQRH